VGYNTVSITANELLGEVGFHSSDFITIQMTTGVEKEPQIGEQSSYQPFIFESIYTKYSSGRMNKVLTIEQKF